MGLWGQLMWLSDRDFCHGVERAVLADGIGFTVLNLMSANPGMRWDIDATRRILGYVPQDGAVPVAPA
jgi:NAD+ dependent glucose-6-phosphate dehydrogenase